MERTNGEGTEFGFSHDMSRRGFIKLGCVAAAAGVLSMWGCSGTASSSSSAAKGGSLTMLNYEAWMGENEVAAFKESTGIVVEELPTPDGGNSAWISTLTKNKGTYDMALAGNNVAKQLHDNGLLADFDASKVPNISSIPESIRNEYPYGIPVEQGKVGFMYNKELLPNPPKSWKELFAQAESLSGQLLFPAYDGDVIDAGMLSLGFDINENKPEEIEQGRDAVIAIKPYIKAFIDSGAPTQIIDGSASLAVAYDYDYATAASESDKVGWVAPEEGMPAYLDGWVALADSKNVDAVYEFMNFHLEPTNYADFINTTCSSWVMDGIESQLTPELAQCEALQPNQASKVIYTISTTESAQAKSSAWQEIQNA